MKHNLTTKEINNNKSNLTDNDNDFNKRFETQGDYNLENDSFEHTTIKNSIEEEKRFISKYKYNVKSSEINYHGKNTNYRNTNNNYKKKLIKNSNKSNQKERN